MDGLGHAVQHLDLVAGVGDPPPACLGDGVRDRAQVVASEGGAHRVVMVVEEAYTPLEVGVGLGLVLVDRDGPTLGPAHHRLGVPIRRPLTS